MWGSWTTAVRLFHLLTLFFIRRRLCAHVIRFSLPFAVSFDWWGGRRPVVTFTGCLLSSSLGRSWRRSSASNTTGGRGISMVLIWPLVAVPWRSRSVLDDRTHFRWGTCRADTIGRHGTLARGLSWWATETGRWWRRWWRNTTSVRAVVWIGNTVRLGWLLLMQWWLRLCMNSLRRKLRRLRMVRARGSMVRLRRRRHATAHWPWWTWRRGASWALRTRTVCRRARRLCV